MVAVTVDPRGWDELGDGLKELEGRKQQLGAAVDVRLGESLGQMGEARIEYPTALRDDFDRTVAAVRARYEGEAGVDER